jgi:hypothetical protein
MSSAALGAVAIHFLDAGCFIHRARKSGKSNWFGAAVRKKWKIAY